MTIDRGPWNALVDDDGSNLVGTVWNKDKIKTVILDPTDAALGGVWIDVALNPADFTASPAGSWSVPSLACFAYQVTGKTMILAFHATNTIVSGTPVGLHLKIPGGFSANRSIGSGYSQFSGSAAGTGWGLVAGNTLQLYRDILGTAWAAGATHLSGVFTFSIA